MAIASSLTVGITNAFEGIAPAASSSSSLSTQTPYDVFINHRGPDVKHTLAATLYNTLNRMGLKVFLDSQELELGDFLPAAIQEAMRTCSLHIAIFSEKYAQSPWCLAELSFMLKTGATIIPVFYHVEPADLKLVTQGKGMYADDFSEHQRKGRYSLEKLQEWRMALYNVSFYSGHIINNNNDAEGSLVKNIVNFVLKVMKKVPLEVAKHPVGLNEAVKDFEMTTLESPQSRENVQIVGIWGMGGSGKTTLAKALYNQKCSSMERSSFLFDVRDAAAKSVLHKKQITLLEDLGVKGVSFDSIEQGKGILVSRLRSVGVLIILDDVDDVDQLDALLPAKDNLGWGSLIIVTTREMQVLRSEGISSVHKMKTLDPSHPRQLFCWHAFLQPYPVDGFEDLVSKFLNVCNGLPLSVKVVEGQLYSNSQEDYWKSQLHKISRILPNNIKERLKVSYDALDQEEKEIFLDTACFFIGVDKDSAIAVWDGSGWSGLHSWERLFNKCLVELDEKNRIRMHDHLRDLGREIANQQSPYRICCPEQIINVEKQVEKRIRIRGIMATAAGSTDEIDQQFPRCSAHGKLIVHTSGGFWRLAPSSLGLRIFVVRGHCFNQAIDKLSSELVWLRWFQIGQRNLPTQLSLKKLRVLELYEDDQLQQLWEGHGDAPLQLRELIISSCHQFQRFPKSMGCLKHLKEIVVQGRSNLRSLPEEFCLLKSLEHLTLRQCTKLLSLPSRFGELTNLRHLDLSFCFELRKLPVSVKHLTLLNYLNLEWCRKLAINLDILENMTKVEYIRLSKCEQLEELPRHIINQGGFLRELYLDDTRLRELPFNIGQLSKLRVIHIGSELLVSLPPSLGNLSSLIDLKIKGCPMMDSLPCSMGRLNLLEHLIIWNSGVKSLPKSVRQLNNLETMYISECPIKEFDFGAGSLGNLKRIHLHSARVSRISISQDCCPRLETLNIWENRHITQIENLPNTVKDIALDDCQVLKNIRCISGMVNLQRLRIISCPGLDTLPSFAQLTCLKKLEIDSLNQVQKLQGLQHCRSLEELRADTWWEVPGIETLEHMERLRHLQLTANNISAVEPCIQTLKRWPGEMIICTRAVRDAGSLVNPSAFPNLSVIDSFANKKINSRPKLLQKRSTPNVNAIMVCFFINCVSPCMKLNIWSSDDDDGGGGGGDDIICETVVQKGNWVWIGLFTQRSCWLTAKQYSIYGNWEDNQVEKGLLVTREEKSLVEAFHCFLALVGN